MSNRVILTLSTIATLDRISTGKCMLNLLRDSLSCLSLYFWSKCNISWKDTKSPTELFLFFNSFSLWHSNRPSQWTIIQAEGVFSLLVQRVTIRICLWLVSRWKGRVDQALPPLPLWTGLSRMASFIPLPLTPVYLPHNGKLCVSWGCGNYLGFYF